MITLRLDQELENNIKNVAINMGISKSELIRRSIAEFMKSVEKPTPWELGNELFGKYASNVTNLSQDRKSLIKAKIKAKR